MSAATPGPFASAAAAIAPVDARARAEAAALHTRLTKPAGSLGALEDLGIRLAAIAGECPPPLPTPAAVAVFAADHGVVARGVTPWPQEVTAQMVANFCAGGAAINVLARQAGASVVVVELFTSQGCSSCPPADALLGELARRPDIVALAFHVDYWDYIGWKDPFASERTTRRQREIQAAAGARYVYTPQVVLGGRDFRGWHSGSAAAFEAIRRTPARATIELAVKAEAGKGIEVTSRASPAAGTKPDGWVLVVAATQDGLSSRVTAGENRGERLAHDFVVRDFAVHRVPGEATSIFKAAPGWNLARMAVSAFLQDPRTGEVLQALSCPIK